MNAYEIMAVYNRKARRAGVSKKVISKVLKEAQSGDYDNLCFVIAQALGDLKAIK